MLRFSCLAINSSRSAYYSSCTEQVETQTALLVAIDAKFGGKYVATAFEELLVVASEVFADLTDWINEWYCNFWRVLVFSNSTSLVTTHRDERWTTSLNAFAMIFSFCTLKTIMFSSLIDSARKQASNGSDAKCDFIHSEQRRPKMILFRMHNFIIAWISYPHPWPKLFSTISLLFAKVSLTLQVAIRRFQIPTDENEGWEIIVESFLCLKSFAHAAFIVLD